MTRTHHNNEVKNAM